ncbi:hypothetical protein GGR95_001520 [Sulfitobacter undariae]|uniref:Uncharacterized protein n=1 Tax=Sulfitobacter undariae TaxID=1563671 RepID=A0A7W6H1L8_9RHOB|nr:hypothetical protein [Sulfitobacter undariae]MBB3993889.1 hypothetical protein [Sulfitobacter undariae]
MLYNGTQYAGAAYDVEEEFRAQCLDSWNPDANRTGLSLLLGWASLRKIFNF